ncbi:hypothetical protein [Halobellus sp. EA9]|uniref:hypothetical protein n=1 Tax=Halobellus sp. EA9 TaxID=3421647 RepID=UPI003EBC0171
MGTTECPECGYDANEAAKQSGKKRAVIGGVVIVLSYGLMSAISGALPSFLGFVGPVIAIPGFLVGGYVGYQGVTKMQAEEKTAADEDTTEELFRGDDYGSLDSITDAFAGENKGSGEPEHVRRERKRKRKVRKQRREHDLPSACPSCSADWTGGGFEIYDDGNQVRCRECGHSKMLFG